MYQQIYNYLGMRTLRNIVPTLSFNVLLNARLYFSLYFTSQFSLRVMYYFPHIYHVLVNKDDYNVLMYVRRNFPV